MEVGTWHQPRLLVTSDRSGERSNSTIFCQSPGAETGLILPSAVPAAPRTQSGMMSASPGTPSCQQDSC